MITKSLRRLFSKREDLLSFVEASVQQLISYHSQILVPEFDTQTPFTQLGFSGLEKTRLVTETELHFGVNLTDHEFLSIASPFDLICLINKYVSAEYALSKGTQSNIEEVATTKSEVFK